MNHDLIGISRHRIGIDGEGVTTLVAFHGCPLRCRFCLNKRSWADNGVWRSFETEQLVHELAKDDLYFRATGGGITLGGGEPLLEVKNILYLRQTCPKHWKFNVETSLNAPGIMVQVILRVVDHWIVDIKDLNPEIYKAYTGEDNGDVIANLHRLKDANAKVTIRVPLIPGYNTPEDVEKSIATLKDMGFSDFDRFTYTIKSK